MSTNKSAHLNLHLWEPEDDFLRTEFNENFEKLDEKVAAAAELPYVIGSYVGDGATSWRDITLGFRPRFLIITAQGAANTAGGPANVRFALVGGNTSITVAYLLSNGFQVRVNESYPYPQLNTSGTTYYYIAFR